MKVATWNVNGIRKREPEFVAWVAQDRPDVICLQELKATVDQLGETLTMLPDYWSVWHGGPKGYSGVSLHLRKDTFPSKPDFGHPPFDMESRVVQARVGSLVFASVYVPNGGKDYEAKLQFLGAMRDHVRASVGAGETLVLCGDMNVARTDADVYVKERKATAIGQRPDERGLFESLLDAGLTDTARLLHPEDDAMFTWWPPWRSMRQKNQGWRIDYVLSSRALEVTECVVRKDVGTSDHAPVMATFPALRP